MAGEWFDVQADGPLFSQRGKPALRAMKEFERSATNKVAKAGQRWIRSVGVGDFRYQFAPATGFYSANVEVERISDGHIVHSNAIYGAWIEGTSSRNQSSRFKGYHLFRRAAQEVESRMSTILNPEERRLVAQLNGSGVAFGPTL